MASITWRPLSAEMAAKMRDGHWRDRSQFKSSYAKTVGELERELDAIDARDVVVEVDITEREIRRRDGGLYDKARPLSPRVVLRFRRSKDAPMVTMPANHYDDWQDNIRALMLTLRALRAVDRYGVTTGGEQYRGFTALPSTIAPRMTIDQAATRLAAFLGNTRAPSDPARDILRDVEIARLAGRRARATTHPDAGGRSEDWAQVQDACALLATHHKVSSL